MRRGAKPGRLEGYTVVVNVLPAPINPGLTPQDCASKLRLSRLLKF